MRCLTINAQSAGGVRGTCTKESDEARRVWGRVRAGFYGSL